MSFRKTLVSQCAILVGGTLFLTAYAAQSAHASREDNFRAFRDQNPDLSRHIARRMFQAERRPESVTNNGGGIRVVTPVINVISSGSDGTISCGAPAKLTRHERLLERKLDHVRDQSMQTQSQSVVRLNNGVDLDLTSQIRNITLGRNLFSDANPSVTITVGGVSKTLAAGSQVTAAEYVAVKQVLGGGSQTVTVGGSGSATGGSVDLSALTSDNDVMRASNLVIAQNVTTSGDFGRRSDFRLLGNLDNYGILQAFSTDSNVRSGAIRANDINNHSNALISSAVDLTLDASNNFRNDGTVVSTQGLTITAGGSVSNTGTASAANGLNLNAASVENKGTIQSTSGDINLNGSENAELNVRNAGGTLSAANGAINVRDASYTGPFNSTVYGGDLLSRDLNLNAGSGTATVNVGKLTGSVNETGLAAHVAAATDVLTIGNVCLTGDPTYYNMLGDISINGNINVPDAVTIVASGNITSTAGSAIHAATANQGKDITLIAGAAFTVNGGFNTPVVPPPVDTSGPVTLSGKSSKTGGSIILASGTVLSSIPTNTGALGNGGDINLFAFAKGNVGGVINVGFASLQSNGASGGASGDIEIVAGSKTEPIILGLITSLTTAPGSGNISVATSQPVLSSKGSVQYGTDGALIGTTHLTSGKSVTGAGVFFNDVTLSNGLLSVKAGGDITVSDTVAGNGSILMNSGGNIIRDSSGLLSSSAVALVAKGSVGSDSVPLVVSTSNLSTIAGGSAFFSSTRNGAFNITGSVGDTLKFNDITGDVQLQDFSGSRVDITSRSVSIDQLTQDSGLQSLILDIRSVGDVFLTLGNIDELRIKAAGNIGTMAAQVTLVDVGTVVLDSDKGAFVGFAGKKAMDFNVTTVDSFTLGGSNGKTVLSHGESANGTVAYGSSGNVTINGDVTGKTGVAITSTGPSNSKIVIKENSTITTTASPLSGVVITVGPTAADNTTPQKNVVSLGNVLIRGAGIKASAPDNHLTGLGTAGILINNGYKLGNVSLGGNVTIQAVGP